MIPVFWQRRGACRKRPVAGDDEDGIEEVENLHIYIISKMYHAKGHTSHVTRHTSQVTHLGKVEHPNDVGEVRVHDRGRSVWRRNELEGKAKAARQVLQKYSGGRAYHALLEKGGKIQEWDR